MEMSHEALRRLANDAMDDEASWRDRAHANMRLSLVDAVYIAALSPSTVIALLNESARLRASLTELVEINDEYGPPEYANGFGECRDSPWTTARAALAGEQADSGKSHGMTDDTKRFEWYFGKHDKLDYINEYMRGMREGWTVDQWRASIDAALRGAAAPTDGHNASNP